MYRAVTWALSMTDKLIILEDDCVPSLSFFPFCKEMLDRYEHDTRVSMIAGFNTDEVSPDVGSDYFFTSVFSIWGWATWRRVAEAWDSDYAFMHDEYNRRQLEKLIRSRHYRPDTWGHPWIKVRYSLEELLLNLRYGRFKTIGRAVKNRLRKVLSSL